MTLKSLSFLCVHLFHSSALQGIRSVFGVKEIVPPAEATCVVPDEFLMVEVVMVSASPDRQEMVKTPRKFVATVGIDSLEQAQDNPGVHGENMQVTSDSTPEDRAADGPEAENHHFNRGSIFSSQTKRCGILMVDFVNGFVEWTPMKSSMEEIVPSVLHHEENRNLICHGPGGWERNRC